MAPVVNVMLALQKDVIVLAHIVVSVEEKVLHHKLLSSVGDKPTASLY